MYSRSQYEYGGRDTREQDRIPQARAVWDSDENPSQFSHGRRRVSGTTDRYGEGSMFGFKGKSPAAAALNTWGQPAVQKTSGWRRSTDINDDNIYHDIHRQFGRTDGFDSIDSSAVIDRSRSGNFGERTSHGSSFRDEPFGLDQGGDFLLHRGDKDTNRTGTSGSRRSLITGLGMEKESNRLTESMRWMEASGMDTGNSRFGRESREDFTTNYGMENPRNRFDRKSRDFTTRSLASSSPMETDGSRYGLESRNLATNLGMKLHRSRSGLDSRGLAPSSPLEINRSRFGLESGGLAISSELEIDRSRYGRESRGLAMSSGFETNRNRVLQSRSNTLYPMETEGMTLNEDGRYRGNPNYPSNVIREPESDIFRGHSTNTYFPVDTERGRLSASQSYATNASLEKEGNRITKGFRLSSWGPRSSETVSIDRRESNTDPYTSNPIAADRNRFRESRRYPIDVRRMTEDNVISDIHRRSSVLRKGGRNWTPRLVAENRNRSEVIDYSAIARMNMDSERLDIGYRQCIDKPSTATSIHRFESDRFSPNLSTEFQRIRGFARESGTGYPTKAKKLTLSNRRSLNSRRPTRPNVRTGGNILRQKSKLGHEIKQENRNVETGIQVRKRRSNMHAETSNSNKTRRLDVQHTKSYTASGKQKTQSQSKPSDGKQEQRVNEKTSNTGNQLWKFIALKLVVRNLGEAEKKNSISAMNLALERSKLDLKLVFHCTELGRIQNKLRFTGTLHIGDVFLARSVSNSRKFARGTCYSKAMKVLMNQSAEDILKLKDKGTKESIDSFQNVERSQKETSTEEIESLDLCEKLKKLISFMNGSQRKACNPMDELNHAVGSSVCQLRREYKEELVEVQEGVTFCKGTLTLDGLLIATVTGKEPKQVKRRTYAKAVDFLKKSPLSVVIDGAAEDKHSSFLSAHDVLSQNHVKANVNTQQKLAKLINLVKKIPDESDIVDQLGLAIRKADVLLTCLYKRGDIVDRLKVFECELYLNCIYICTAEGHRIQEAGINAYREAFTVLSNSSSDTIFNDFKQVTSQDVQGVIEVSEDFEGKRILKCFNSNLLRSNGLKSGIRFEPVPDYREFPRDWQSMIIMEQDAMSSDRLNRAYDILFETATKNFTSMFRKIGSKGSVRKCELFLQGEKLAAASGRNNGEASAKAAAKILFKLYENQPTIKLLSEGDYSRSCHTYESIKEKADKMKAESEDSGTDDFIVLPWTQQNNQEELMEEEDSFIGDSDAPSSTLQVNKWVKQVVEVMIEDFAETESLEELVFGPGFPLGDQKQIKITATKHHVYSVYRKAPDKDKTVSVFQKHSPEKMLEILEANDGACGKYVLVPKKDLPRLADLEADNFGISMALQESHFK